MQQAFAAEVARLSSDDVTQLTEATALICLLLSNPALTGLEATFKPAVDRILELTSHESSQIRKNAFAIITATCSQVENGRSLLDVPATLKAVLASVRAHSADDASVLNGMYTLAELASTSESTVDQFLEGGGSSLAVGVLKRDGDIDNLREAALHLMCRCAAASPACHGAFVDDGVLAPAVQLLSCSIADISVRAAMLLGMVTGRSEERQVLLAQTPGAVAALLALVRGEPDPDAKAIASDLFKLLAANVDARDLVTAALRQDVSNDTANFL